MQVHIGKLPVQSAIKQVESAIEALPKVANAEQRLLGIQMGADVHALDKLAADSEGKNQKNGQSPEDWVPKAGEQVTVCTSHGV